MFYHVLLILPELVPEPCAVTLTKPTLLKTHCSPMTTTTTTATATESMKHSWQR